MRALLMCSGLWSVVSGKATKPAKSTDLLNDNLAKWETKLEKAAGEIYLGVESDQRVHFRGQEDDPKAMWDSLKKAHLHQKLLNHVTSQLIGECITKQSGLGCIGNSRGIHETDLDVLVCHLCD